MEGHKVRYKGLTFTIVEHNGRFSGDYTGRDPSSSLSEATRKEYKARSSAFRESDRQQRAESAERDRVRKERESRSTYCSACSKYVTNMKNHETTRTHKNAIAYEQYRQSGRRF